MRTSEARALPGQPELRNANQRDIDSAEARRRTPEGQLLTAVLLRAIKDLDTGKDRASAYEFLYGDESAVGEICEALGFSAVTLREWLNRTDRLNFRRMPIQDEA